MTEATPTDGARTQGPVLDVPQDVLDHFAKLGVDATTFSGGHLGDKLGIRIIEASGDRVLGTMPVEGNQQPYGLLHGGASAALAETLGSIGAMLHAGPGRYAVGVDLNVTHHRSATSGLVTGVATAVFKAAPRRPSRSRSPTTPAGGSPVAD